MSTPLDEGIKQNPTPAVITPTGGPAYSSGEDYVPGAGQSYPVVGSFISGMSMGLANDLSGILTISAADMPPGTADGATVVVGTTTYTVSKIRQRVWEGRVAGYTLMLA